jgi:hypothetical protein
LSVLKKKRRLSRITKHGGETIDAPAEWQKYFSPTEKKGSLGIAVMAPNILCLQRANAS